MVERHALIRVAVCFQRYVNHRSGRRFGCHFDIAKGLQFGLCWLFHAWQSHVIQGCGSDCRLFFGLFRCNFGTMFFASTFDVILDVLPATADVSSMPVTSRGSLGVPEISATGATAYRACADSPCCITKPMAPAVASTPPAITIRLISRVCPPRGCLFGGFDRAQTGRH